MSGPAQQHEAPRAAQDELPPRPELYLRVVRAALHYPVAFLSGIGDMVLMTLRTLAWMVRPPYRIRLMLQAMQFIGVGSLFIIALTALTTGMVLALQAVYSARMFNAEGIVGGAVALSLTRELSPVLTGLMLTARASSAIATELGTMRVTDQIDALSTMGVNPTQYLIVPRVAAAAVMTPVLCLMFTFVGMVGAYIVAVVWMDVDVGPFLDKISRWIGPGDFVQSIVKSFIFGTLTILIACHQGFTAKGGAAGVGLATTRAVVLGSVTIMVCDYMLTAVML
jgi:phospholipid/cholesterol/gamma-HCH transport system permease protein